MIIIRTRCLSPCSTRWLNHSKCNSCVWGIQASPVNMTTDINVSSTRLMYCTMRRERSGTLTCRKRYARPEFRDSPYILLMFGAGPLIDGGDPQPPICYLYIFTGLKRSVDRLGTLAEWLSKALTTAQQPLLLYYLKDEHPHPKVCPCCGSILPHGIFRIRHGRQFIGDFPYAVPLRQGLVVLFRLDTPANWRICDWSVHYMPIYPAPKPLSATTIFRIIDFY